MASTNYQVGSDEARKIYATDLNRVVMKKTSFMKLASRDTTRGCIEIVDDLKKNVGDTVYTYLEYQLAGAGRFSGEQLEGHEEALRTARMTTVLDQTRHAVGFEGVKMNAQRVPWAERKRARNALSDWMANYLDNAIAYQLCGYTADNVFASTTAATRAAGHNAIAAPTRKIYADVLITADQSLTTGDQISLAAIDRAVVIATDTTGDTPPMRPIRIEGEDYFVLTISPRDLYQLRQSGTDWNDVMLAAMQGGEVGSNPLFTGTTGLWNGTIIKVNSRITPGVNGSNSDSVDNCRRSVFCGSQGAVIAWGRDSGETRYDWQEETKDYKNFFGVAVDTVVGIKKQAYTPPGGSLTDHGVLVIASYAPAVT